MKWVVVSPRVGVPGTEYDIAVAEANDINVAGLIAGGFIKAVEESAPSKLKPSKVKKEPKE